MIEFLSLCNSNVHTFDAKDGTNFVFLCGSIDQLVLEKKIGNQATK
jgi:hypothetical protein